MVYYGTEKYLGKKITNTKYDSIVKNTITYGAETWKFKKNLDSRHIDGNAFVGRSDEMPKIIEKIGNNIVDYIKYKYWICIATCVEWTNKDYLKKFGNVLHL